MPKLLDLFCGAGGAAMGYARAGFEVVGVDIKPQPHYPFEFIQTDAMTYLPMVLDEPRRWVALDAIHASPPCQDYSRALRHLAAPQPRLIAPLLAMLKGSDYPYVIENVVGAPLATQPTLDGVFGVELCGTMFGLRVWRHRLFECSFPLYAPEHGCDHREPALNPHNQRGRDRLYSEFGKQNPDPLFNAAMGVPWMNKEEGREAIPPAYTEFLGGQILEHLRRESQPVALNVSSNPRGRGGV